jgi:hypothetical protein
MFAPRQGAFFKLLRFIFHLNTTVHMNSIQYRLSHESTCSNFAQQSATVVFTAHPTNVAFIRAMHAAMQQ